jgi:hypothetical protein
VVLSRGGSPGVLLAAGERSSVWLSPCWLFPACQRSCHPIYSGSDSRRGSYLSVSFARACVFLRLGVGMRHSMEKAVQLVHGTPRLAASHRTYAVVMRCPCEGCWGARGDNSPFVHGRLWSRSLADVLPRPRCRGIVWISKLAASPLRWPAALQNNAQKGDALTLARPARALASEGRVPCLLRSPVFRECGPLRDGCARVGQERWAERTALDW